MRALCDLRGSIFDLGHALRALSRDERIPPNFPIMVCYHAWRYKNLVAREPIRCELRWLFRAGLFHDHSRGKVKHLESINSSHTVELPGLSRNSERLNFPSALAAIDERAKTLHSEIGHSPFPYHYRTCSAFSHLDVVADAQQLKKNRLPHLQNETAPCIYK